KNLQLVVSPYVNVHHAVRADSYSGGIKKYMKDLGWDPNLYSNEPNMLMTRWTTAILKSGPALGMGYYQGWMLNTEKDYCDLYPRSQGVYVMHHWDEVPLFTPGAKVYNKKQRKWDYENDWPFSATLGRVEVQAGGENAREPFVQAMIASDPEFILFGFLDANMIVGHEQQLREFVKVFRALPKKEFVRFGNTGFNTNLAIRETKQGDCCFYVANPGYWPVSGQVVLSDAGDIVDLSDNRKAVTKQSGKNTIVPIALKPYGIAAYRVSGRSKLVSWTTKPAPDKELVHMRNIIAQAENILKKQKTNKTLSTEDIAFMERTVRNAEADLTAGKYASAWAYLSNGHFWTLLRNRSGYKKTYEKGMAEYKAKKYKEAAAALEEAAKLAETPDEKYNSMVYQGYSLRNMRKYAESAKIYDNLMKVENLSVAQKNNAFIQYLNNIYSGKKYEDVISTAEKTIADDKASGNMKTIAAFRACLASNNLRKYDDRIKWAKKLQELNPKGIWHSRGLIYQAQTLRTQKKYQEAEELLSKENIAEMHPYRQGEAYLERADIKTAQKKYAEAVLEYTAIYELPKGNPNHKAMAIAYAIEKLNMAGKPEEAQVWIERVDTIKNKYWKTRSLFYQARMLQKQGKLKAAKEKWEECKKSGKWWQKEADKQIAVIDKKLGAK
ncbi:MAG: tetratricopeptide repeat protein, partial [Victivallales bacterium]